MKQEKVLDFMRFRHIAVAVSLVLVIVSLLSLSLKGLNFGLDFSGGTLIELKYENPLPLDKIRLILKRAQYKNVTVQNAGSSADVMIRILGDNPKLGKEVVHLLSRHHTGNIELRRSEFVGPQVGADLREQGGLGMLFALLLIMLYIALRFQYKFSVGAVISLAHDVIIVLGCFSLFGFQFDLTVLAAVLSVIGYSLNDTIIVFDRIRENFQKTRMRNISEIINLSWSQMLGRTLATSSTTLIVLLCLFVYGGDMIHTFAIALIIGVWVGTYSSVYVAASILMFLKLTREDMLVAHKKEVDNRP